MLCTSISVCIQEFSLSAVKHGNRHDYNFTVCSFLVGTFEFVGALQLFLGLHFKIMECIDAFL